MPHATTPCSTTTGPTPNRRLWRPTVALVTGLSALLLACASRPPAPHEQIAEAEAAVESAVRAGATTSAPADLALARDKLARANASMESSRYERAQMLAEAALVDARLTEAKARLTQATKAASTVQDDHRVLRQEIERGAAQ